MKADSRHNHRYAVVVQELATQWIQSYPFATKTSQKTETSLRKFLVPSVMPESHLTILWTLAKPVKNYPGIIVHLRLTRSETNGIAERAVRRVYEGTSAVPLVAIRPGRKMVGGFHGMFLIDAKRSRPFFRMEKHLMKGRFGEPIPRTSNSFWFNDGISSYFCQEQVKTPPVR